MRVILDVNYGEMNGAIFCGAMHDLTEKVMRGKLHEGEYSVNCGLTVRAMLDVNIEKSLIPAEYIEALKFQDKFLEIFSQLKYLIK